MSSHRVLSPLITLLAIVTGVTLFATGWTLASPVVADPLPVATEQVVRDFYAAINLGIRTGDTSSLDNIVLEGVGVHGGPATFAPDRAGLTRYVNSLHATSPQLELSVVDIVSVGDRSLVDIAIQGPDDGEFLGSPISDVSPWGAVDALRVNNRRVAEYWSGANGMALFEPLAQTPFSETAGDRAVALDRLTISPGESFVAEGTDESRWLFVESGQVTISTTHLDWASMTWGLEPDLTMMPLAAGDLCTVPVWSRTELLNEGREPASLLVLAVGLTTRDTPRMDPAYPQGQSTTHAGMKLPSWWAGVQERTDGAPMVTSLTGNAKTTIPEGRGTLIVSQVTLAPGTVLSIREAKGPHLVVVNSGLLDLITSDKPEQTSRGNGFDPTQGEQGVGASALLHPGTEASLRNFGMGPVVVTIVAILPAEA